MAHPSWWLWSTWNQTYWSATHLKTEAITQSTWLTSIRTYQASSQEQFQTLKGFVWSENNKRGVGRISKYPLRSILFILGGVAHLHSMFTGLIHTFRCLTVAVPHRTLISLPRVSHSLGLHRLSSSMASRKQLPDGVFPTMITPFLDDDKKSIDWNGVDRKE